MASVPSGTFKLALPFAVLALAACGGDEAEPAYEAGVADESGGELIVTDPNEPAVPVDVPEVEMTNVPADEADAATDAATPAPAE